MIFTKQVGEIAIAFYILGGLGALHLIFSVFYYGGIRRAFKSFRFRKASLSLVLLSMLTTAQSLLATGAVPPVGKLLLLAFIILVALATYVSTDSKQSVREFFASIANELQQTSLDPKLWVLLLAWVI